MTWGRQHEHAALLWSAWDGTSRSAPAVVEVCRERLGIEVSAAEVSRHFLRHRVEQPAPAGPLRKSRAYARTERLAPRFQALIDVIFRVRALSTRQIVQLFYERAGRAPRLATEAARRDLSALARADMLYRFYPEKGYAGLKADDPLWFLGRDAAAWLEVRYEKPLTSEHYITMAKQVRPGMLDHDLCANAVFIAFSRAATSIGEIIMGSSSVRVALHPSNWLGPRQLALSFADRVNGRERIMIPDGFCAIALRGGPGGPQGTLLPLFYEYDRGSRPVKDVCEQLLAYHWLALAGAAARRFPELDVEGYSVPVVMVLREARRIANLQRRLRARAQALNIRRGAPILLVSEEDLHADPLASRAFRSAWADPAAPGLPLVAALSALSRPLIDSRRVSAHTVLRVDLSAVKRRPQGFVSAPRQLVEA